MDKMNELEKLGLKYGTDKGTKHNYLKVYYEMFKDRRKDVRKVLEIGTAEGAGMKMFREFFPHAFIYGAEIDQKRVDLLKDEERMMVWKCDQTKREDLIELILQVRSGIDLVIDDGSHRSADQVFTFNTIFPLLDGNAIYVIEDVAHEPIINYLNLEGSASSNVRKVGERYDDRLLIIRK